MWLTNHNNETPLMETVKDVHEKENLSQDLFGADNYEAAPRLKKIFLPWHRPRKQFVRDTQWSEQIKKLIHDFTPTNNTISYLGLPGDDLLDLRYFHEKICVPNGLGLKYLGFNTSADAKAASNSELNISKDELNKMKHIDPTSNVIPDDICQIANKKSLAWNHAFAMSPFDVVNIDLCDGFAKEPPAKFLHTHYDALSQLLTLQAKQKTPWLLFLTTRTGANDIDADVLKKFQLLYQTNLKECESFLAKSGEYFSIIDEQSMLTMMGESKGVTDIFLVSLCKWISGILLSQIPASKAKLKSVIGYKVVHNTTSPDLVSIALRIEPNYTPKEDSLGLTKARENALNECAIATQIIDRVHKQVDADDVLHNNDQLMREMVDTSIELLQTARYDVSKYKDWLQGAKSH